VKAMRDMKPSPGLSCACYRKVVLTFELLADVVNRKTRIPAGGRRTVTYPTLGKRLHELCEVGLPDRSAQMGEMPVRLGAGRHEDELRAPDLRDRRLDHAQLRRVDLVVGEVDGEQPGGDLRQQRRGV